MTVLCVFTVTHKPTEEDKKLLETKFKPKYITWNFMWERREFAALADEWLRKGKDYAVMTKTTEI